MRDFPVFTTKNGVGSLILREVPYRGEAYIRVESAQDLPGFLKDCADFCRAVGAERIYASGHPELEQYPLHTAVLMMRADREALGETQASVLPVTEATLDTWREIYNRRMARVSNASWMTEAMAKEMLHAGEGYLVHRDGTLLGIGRVSGDRLEAVVSQVPGAGADVVKALCRAVPSENVVLEVASANKRAVALYERLGFLKTRELSRWYTVK